MSTVVNYKCDISDCHGSQNVLNGFQGWFPLFGLEEIRDAGKHFLPWKLHGLS
jgi:hypothetical protein